MENTLACTPAYARTLTGNPNVESIYVMARDSVNPSRVWGQGVATAMIGFSDDDGVNFTTKIANPDAGSGYGVQQLVFSPSYAWLVTAGISSKQGRLHRSALPDASGNGLSWSLKFDLSTGGGGVGSAFRNSSFAISEPYCYLGEYGAVGGTVTGGPSIFRSSDTGATWTNVKTFSNGKHAHAVKVIGGVPWASIGDTSSTFTDVGLWNATAAAAGTWNQRSIFTPYGGTVNDMINFFQISMEGVNVIVGESDNHYGYGPLIFPSIGPSSSMAIVPLNTLRAPFFGSMQGLVQSFEGNLIWATSGEAGAIGQLDAMLISRPPFSEAILLESLSPGTLTTIRDVVEHGPYVFYDLYRITKPRFVGQ